MTNTTYTFKKIKVDLTKGEVSIEKIDEKESKKFIGGRGLATKWLYDAGIAKVDPLSPENKIVFINGPLTGSNSPTAGRYMVVTKQPLNNKIGSANSGGVWGAKLKYAGYDAIEVDGKSDKPVYLFIEGDHVELKDASDLWGKVSSDVDGIMKERYGDDSSSLYIGPAGENQSLLACVLNDTDRAAGRGGAGAVMGSKNLKAITIKQKNGVMEPYDKEAMMKAFKESIAIIQENEVTSTGLPTYGTAVLVNIINSIGALPTNNWQEAYFEDAEDISGERLADTSLVKNSHCHRCPIGCGRVVKVKDRVIGGPEYEPIWAYGSDLGNKDLDSINRANELCNEYGLDAISFPCTLAAAMELYQRGIITEEELEGQPSLEWGDADAIIEWTEKAGKADGELATLMADGSDKLCEKYNAKEYSMASKKLELPAYDARAIQGIGLNYATSNRGGCHVRGYTVSPEVMGLPEQHDRTTTEGKPELVKVFQDLTAAIDSLGVCLFTSFALGAPEYAALYNAATNSNLTPDELVEAGERIYNLERLFNKEAGMTADEDALPKRLTDEPIPSGPSKGMVSKLDEMLPKYYEVRGWKDAFPTDETIKKLGLEK